jgi:hypothetical protein
MADAAPSSQSLPEETIRSRVPTIMSARTNCSRCGLGVHWVSGLGVSPGRWAYREPAPHGEPALQPRNLRRYWVPTLMSDCRIAVSSADGLSS